MVNIKPIFLLAIFLGLYSCKEVPEGMERPFARISWDTIVAFPRVIFPNDTLVILTDGTSQTEENHLDCRLDRFPISNQFEFLGPDSDWVFKTQFKLEGKVIKRAAWKLGIPEGLRPGIYSFKGWWTDATGMISDTSRFSFVLNTFNYPAISILRPQEISNKVLIPFDSVRAAYRLPLRLQGAPANPGNEFYFQWLDSSGRITLSDSMPLDGKVTEGSKICDTVLVPPASEAKLYQIKIGYQTPEKRRMEYRYQLYRK